VCQSSVLFRGNAARRVELHFQPCVLRATEWEATFACRARRLWSEVGGKCSGAFSRSSSLFLHYVTDLHGRSVKEITPRRVEVDDALGAFAGELEPSSGHVARDEVPRRMRGRDVSH
jgi:hypothetical protein